MKIIIDGFGGDNAPLETIKGARLAKDEYGADIILTGSEAKLRAAAEKAGVSLDGIEILNAGSEITMEDSPADVVRAKKDCSMAVGLEALRDGRGDAFVSAGNTGALVIGSRSIIGCVEGLRRAALAPILPTDTGRYMLIDAGANAECRPEMLLKFGYMGSIYMQKVLKVESPRVGLANIGAEETKGTPLQRDAYKLLKASDLNFTGNAEPRYIPLGNFDVVVADGFTGNIILKLTEGVGLAFAANVKRIFTKNALTKLAAAMVMPGLKSFKKKMDYSEYGGAPLMGIAKPVIKAHGSSNANAYKNAVRQAIAFVDGGVLDEIAGSFPKDEESAE
jgi:glycerol-3-phosphate acyltransferase PlsX